MQILIIVGIYGEWALVVLLRVMARNRANYRDSIKKRKVLLSLSNSIKIFEREILSSNSVIKSATQKPSVFCN